MATLLVLATAATAGAGVTKNETEVFTLPGFALVDGASMDARITGGGVNISAHTNGLTGGNAYTLWSISFSHPEHCTHGDEAAGLLCGMGDDGPGPQGFAFNQVGGNIAGASGNLTISGHVNVENAAGAEYHVVVADHGPLDPSDLPHQIMSPAPGVQIGFFVP
jgi:hypothetical protein